MRVLTIADVSAANGLSRADLIEAGEPIIDVISALESETGGRVGAGGRGSLVYVEAIEARGFTPLQVAAGRKLLMEDFRAYRAAEALESVAFA